MSLNSLITTSPASVPASWLRREAARKFGALFHRDDDDQEESRDEVALAELDDDEGD
ncbi:MAG TPA: hypothetical protein VML75_19890 [Kofleriaceae bacterium]|nr:hypothetical protein [Kofleriaceae bacterium]